METIRVLSIDGGGIRGIIPLMVLAHIEETIEYPIHAGRVTKISRNLTE
jgi:patatin-like phospholipase/acyl hydrolase